jgi:hypothetical protein
MSIPITIETLRALQEQDEANYGNQRGFNSDFCPGFQDGNPSELPCDCPKAREYLLGAGEGQMVCYSGVCPVRKVLEFFDK